MSTPPSEANAAATAPGQGRGQVFERGYRHYEGRREGRSYAVRALILYSIKRGLGIKKRWTAKIIPFLLYAASFFPVIIILGVRALLGPVAEGFNYVSLFGGLSVVLLLFAATVAPEMLCDDRHENVLPLYFSRPITRGDYLFAKISALAILMGSIALAPALLLFLGNTLLAPSPFGYLRDNLADIARIIATGGLIAVFYSAIGLVVAAYNRRKGVAAAIYIGVMLVGAGIIEGIFETTSGAWKRYLALVSPASVPDGITGWIFGAGEDASRMVREAGLHGAWYLLSVAVVTALCGVVMYRRYLVEE